MTLTHSRSCDRAVSTHLGQGLWQFVQTNYPQALATDNVFTAMDNVADALITSPDAEMNQVCLSLLENGLYARLSESSQKLLSRWRYPLRNPVFSTHLLNRFRESRGVREDYAIYGEAQTNQAEEKEDLMMKPFVVLPNPWFTRAQDMAKECEAVIAYMDELHEKNKQSVVRAYHEKKKRMWDCTYDC